MNKVKVGDFFCLKTKKNNCIFEVVKIPSYSIYGYTLKCIIVHKSTQFLADTEYLFNISFYDEHIWSRAELGLNCRKCQAYNEYAEPNQSDGYYMCYNCRI